MQEAKDNICEMCCIKLEGKSGKYSILLGIYRPPRMNSIDEFIEILTETLIKLTDVNHDIIIAGDLNIDLMSDTRQVTELLDILQCFKLEPQFRLPTRVTKDSKTCIDHIHAEGREVVEGIDIVKTEVSDHYAQIFDLTHSKMKKKKFTTIKKRLINDQTLSYLRILLEKETWENVLSNNNPNETLDEFIKTFNYYYYLACPLKWKKSKRKL